MLGGIISVCGKAVGAIRGCTKVMLGQHPNSPFQLMSLLGQFYSPGGGGAARSEGMSDNRAGSIMDNANHVSRMASMSAARAPAPPPPRS